MDLESNADLATRLCLDAQRRLERSVADLDDEAIRVPSKLPAWTRAHVITHLARNADAHARRLRGALEGVDVAKYPGGASQRRAEIEHGAASDAATIRRDLIVSQHRLSVLLRQARDEGWPNSHFLGGGHYGVKASPAHRLREVEMHHVDLNLAYQPADWPLEYVVPFLPPCRSECPGYVTSRASLPGWLAGASPTPHGRSAPGVELGRDHMV